MTLALEIAVSLVAVAAAVFLGWRLRGRPRPRSGAARVLVPFTGGALEPRVLQAAIRIARAEEAVLVPAYLLVVPLQYSEDSPLKREVEVAMPLLEAVERTAGRAGVAVDARIEKGRTPTHALKRLWEVERFDRVLAPAPVENGPGFSPKDLTWILTHAPTETLILRPGPACCGPRHNRSDRVGRTVRVGPVASTPRRRAGACGAVDAGRASCCRGSTLRRP